jgi:effector-binding domain-containing protein
LNLTGLFVAINFKNRNMKTIVKIFYWLLGIIAVLVIISYLLPKTYKVERFVFIKSNPDLLYGLTSNFQKWHLWAPWTKETDSTVIFEMTGEAAQVGTSWKWKGDVLGNGEMILSELMPGRLIAYNLAFDHGKYQSKGKITLENQGDSVKVSWIDEGDLGYNPMNRYMGLFMGKMMGPDFTKGLEKLKKVAEERNTWPKIEEKVMPEQVVLLIRDSATMNTYSSVLDKAFGEIMMVVNKNKLTCTGAPFAIYLKWDSVTMSSVMDIGFPVQKAEKAQGRIRIEKIPAQKAVIAIYFGSYDKTGAVYHILEQYIQESGMEIAGSPWEIYVTDPMAEKDPMKIETDILFPVK